METKRHLLVNWKRLHPTSVHTITRRQVASHLATIEADRGAVTAARARAALSAMFNWAIREGLDVPANPVLGTNRPAEPGSRDRVLSPEELRAIWHAAGDEDYGHIVRLLMLTGQRRDEIGGLRWTEINGDAVALPPQRTKNRRAHTVPLSPQAKAILERQPRTDRPYVFGIGEGGFSGWSVAKTALDARLDLPEWRLHDLRRTCATVMADKLGVLPHVIEAVLNHVSGHRAGVAGVYNRATYGTECREALDRWADYVTALTARGK